MRKRGNSYRSRVLGATLGVLLIMAAGATASHFDSIYKTANANWNCNTSLYCQTDNTGLTVHRQDSLSSSGKSNVAATLNNSYTTTDLNVSFDSTPEYTGGSETDIIYQQNASRMPSSTTIGIAWCDDPYNIVECDQHYVAFRYSTPSIPLACHETGHAVGLTHGADASPAQSNSAYDLRCMRTPVPDDQYLGSHNAAQINSVY